jgi:class 3 adenylate cyclase
LAGKSGSSKREIIVRASLREDSKSHEQRVGRHSFGHVWGGSADGAVTLVFTDIEGSTRLLEELGQAAYRDARSKHREVVREAFGQYEGYEVDTEGDSFFYAFPSATGAVKAVEEALTELEGGPITVAVGVHTGEPGRDGRNYVGLDVHTAARLMAAGHGGQVVLSQSTRELLDDSFVLVDLGEHRLKADNVRARTWMAPWRDNEIPADG